MSKKTKAVREAKLQRQVQEFAASRSFICPQCKKQRLLRPHNHVVSLEKKAYKTPSGGSVELLIDICTNCFQRNKRQYFDSTPEDIRKVLKAMKDGTKSDVSLEEML
jgi:hypothetical protein